MWYHIKWYIDNKNSLGGIEKIIEKVQEKTKDVKEKIKEEKKPLEKKTSEKKKEKKPKGNLKIKIIVILILTILLLLTLSTVFGITTMASSKIISGVSINGIDVSGLTKEEACKKLEEKLEERKNTILNLKYEEYENVLPLEQLEISSNIEEVVNKAESLGRNNNVFINNIDTIKSKF